MIISVAKKKKRLRSESKEEEKKRTMIHIPRMRGEVETMVTALVLEERLSRGNDARWIDHILRKMQIKPQMSGASLAEGN